MKSIRSKLLKNFLIVIILTVVILDILALLCLKGYYYKNTQDTLVNQLEGYINFYQKYFSNNKLIDNIYENMDVFWNTNQEQVEILDPNGKLLMDSYGIRDSYLLTTPDIQKAKEGEVGVWTGDVSSYNDKIMVVSKAIKSKLDPNETIGIVRIIFSLKEVHKVIDSFSVLFLFISIIVIVLGIIMSLIIAKDIVSPIKKITDVAREMAKGNLNIRSDVTDNIEIAQLSKTLNYMGCEVEKREKLKNEFISSVSHELRTPLTAIKGWVITLNDDETDKETLKMGFDIIEKETDRLTLMVEELLDFSKLVSGIVHLNKRNVDIRSFVTHIENYMKPRAVNEDIVFNVDISNNVSKGFFDYNKMKQVLINILDNAFKFTEDSGEVSINAKSENNFIIVSISDKGCGMSKDTGKHIFEKFYQGDTSHATNGNGLGLALVKRIIDIMNADIYIESTLGKGTTFTVKLDLNKNKIYNI